MKSSFSTPGFLWPLLTLICLLLILVGLYKTTKKTEWSKSKKQFAVFSALVITAIWVAILTVFAYKGFFADFSKLPPRPALILIIPLPFILLFSFSKTGVQLLKLVPAHWLVAIQSFRIFVEILLWFAFLANKLPIQMSFEGGNFDIFSGLLALPAAYLIAKKKDFSQKVIIVFNVIGILLLLNILVIAVLSMPTSFRYFMNEPSNVLVAQFPFILLPGVLVPIAYSFHVFSIRQFFIKKKSIHVEG